MYIFMCIFYSGYHSCCRPSACNKTVIKTQDKLSGHQFQFLIEILITLQLQMNPVTPVIVLMGL